MKTAIALLLALANNVNQAANHTFHVPFANVPQNGCIAAFSPPQLNIPGNQGERMTGSLQVGQCAVISAYMGFPAWECDLTLTDTPSGIVSKVTAPPYPNVTACSYTNGIFRYAWK